MIVKNVIRTCPFDGEVDHDYLEYTECCDDFAKIKLDYKHRPSKLYKDGKVLNFCPFCGEKIEYITDEARTDWG
jgi:hypothetical protein